MRALFDPKRFAALLSFFLLVGCATLDNPRNPDLARWEAQADRVTIARDDWGIAHVRGRSDADAVFGMIYAQAEDDFFRVETNYLTSLGRLAEAEGESAIWADLRQRLFIDEADLRARYAGSPAWLQRLMTAWADGLNYYLHTHPEVRPRVITRFEPWMALSFSEGSIGGDIERVSLNALRAFYEAPRTAAAGTVRGGDPGGSNGIAIGRLRSASGNALLLINPHTTFFFRDELQMTSDEGLNAYGAVTWGQFFIYQGFNDRVGWMHTTSGADAVDEFLETIVRRDGRLFYRYGEELRPVTVSTIAIPYRTQAGGRAERSFQVYRTHHGPIIRAEGGKWVSIALMHRPVEALSQSYLRTKARNFRDYLQVMSFQANSSNNTVYADADGHIALLVPQFIPRRDDRFDYLRPVDGSDPATDWRGLHALTELPAYFDPPTGWIQNTNNWPFSAAGPASLRREAYPRYMDEYGENPRGLHALRLLAEERSWTLDSLQAAAFDRWLPAFDRLLPPLLAAYDRLERGDARRARLGEPVARLRRWDRRWDAASAETTLAIFFADALRLRVSPTGFSVGMATYDRMAAAASEVQLGALGDALDRLARDFGRWDVPWGEINRFQRLTGAINQPFSDASPSLPVAFPSARWGSLAAFEAAPRGTRRWYGTRGNSFVAVVEFGPRVRARAVTAGGVSGDPRSPHFNDQAQRYATGDLREVYFYPDQLEGHVERRYRPGER